MIQPKFLITIINFIINLVEGLIGLRIVLKLFGASTTASFTRWVYETSDQLISPFIGMFPSPRLSGGFIIEFSALFALLVYAFIAYLIIAIIETLSYQADERLKKNKK
jgi:hypothetical protein